MILRGVPEKWACSKGGVDLALDFKNFWDGVYNFFFLPPPPPKKWLLVQCCAIGCKNHHGEHCSHLRVIPEDKGRTGWP